MLFRLLLLAIVLTASAGCDEDTQKPRDMQVGITDLRLTVALSADTIARGDTLHILMAARNPYRSPLDVTFPSSCQDAFWVYDSDGHDVSPDYMCAESPYAFHMDPLEVRRFDLLWQACDKVKSGRHTVVAGFHPLLGEARHTAEPITIEILPREEDVSGEWAGTSYDFWGLPGWEDHHIVLALEQLGSTVSGTFAAGGPTYRIESGHMMDTQLEFAITYESEGVVVEFTGDVCRDQIMGTRNVVDLVSQEILNEAFWFVYRVE